MKLRYEIKTEDVLALFRYQNDHTPTYRRMMRSGRWWFSLGMFVMVLVASSALTSFDPDPVTLATNAIIGCVADGVVFLTFPSMMRNSIDRLGRRLLREGKSETLLGSQELELTDSGLFHRNRFVESRAVYSIVDQVVPDGGHTFIFTSVLSAVIIPHAAVTEGDPAAFTAALRQKLADTVPTASCEKSSFAAAV